MVSRYGSCWSNPCAGIERLILGKGLFGFEKDRVLDSVSPVIRCNVAGFGPRRPLGLVDEVACNGALPALFTKNGLDETRGVFYVVVFPSCPCAVIFFVTEVVVCKGMGEVGQDTHLAGMGAYMAVIEAVSIGPLG